MREKEEKKNLFFYSCKNFHFPTLTQLNSMPLTLHIAKFSEDKRGKKPKLCRNIYIYTHMYTHLCLFGLINTFKLVKVRHKSLALALSKRF